MKEFYETTKMIKVLGHDSSGIGIEMTSFAAKMKLTKEKLEQVAEVLYAEDDVQFSSTDKQNLCLLSTKTSVAA